MNIVAVQKILDDIKPEETVHVALMNGVVYSVFKADIDLAEEVMTVYPADGSLHRIAYNAIAEIFLETY